MDGISLLQLTCGGDANGQQEQCRDAGSGGSHGDSSAFNLFKLGISRQLFGVGCGPVSIPTPGVRLFLD